jgi:signal-transduction protein with cAMP-binding, CBS, and nucleotidyltransferase domain
VSYVDEFEHWLGGTDNPAYDAMFDEELGRLKFAEPVILPPSAPLRDAITLMNDREIGCILVGTKTRLVGIFTERDVMGRVTVLDVDLDDSILADFMTPNPECLGIDDQIVHALNAMIMGGYRHVPVLCEGRPVGVFGMRDCMRLIVDLHPRAVLNAPPPGMKHAARREGE